jgi:hypothetical protein
MTRVPTANALVLAPLGESTRPPPELLESGLDADGAVAIGAGLGVST